MAVASSIGDDSASRSNTEGDVRAVRAAHRGKTSGGRRGNGRRRPGEASGGIPAPQPPSDELEDTPEPRAETPARSTIPILNEADWLGRVREVRHPIDLNHPVKIKHRLTEGGTFPQPSIPFPERHPYCEINFLLQGGGNQYLGMEKVERIPGEIMLIGPGIPHYGTYNTSPLEIIVVYFLPVVLFEMGPGGDGSRMLARFTASRSISRSIVHLPREMEERFGAAFKTMVQEAQHERPGWEFCVRSRLMDVLVELVRWEEASGKGVPPEITTPNWVQIEKILQFIYEHYAEPLYIEQIAREAGLNTDNLNSLFHEAFGMSCVQYLRAYRISHAASLLCLPGARVTEVAFAVGFETLSHFNTSFRRFQGMSPREYIRMHKPVK